MEDRALVGVAFFDSLDKGARGKSFIERMIQRNQRYWHTEVAFEKDLLPVGHPLRSTRGDFLVAYGITAHELDRTIGKVFERKRVFTAANYRWKFLHVPRTDALRAMSFARAQIGKLYDRGGHTAALWNPRDSHYHSRKWYCANLTAAILQQATPTIRGVHPGTLSMDDIYGLLNNEVEMTNTLSPKQRSDLLRAARARMQKPNIRSNKRV